MRTRTVAALGVLAWTLAGCGAAGEVYPLSIGKVESRLKTMSLPAELGFGAGGGSDASVESVSSKGVTWRISTAGATLGWLEADLEAVDIDHTRVEVDFRPADNASSGQQRFLSTMGRVVLSEAVDAELDGRAFNKGRVQTQIAAYALTHRDEVASWDLDESMVSDEMRAGHVSAAVAKNPELGVAMREAETRRTMKAASEPSLKLGEDRYKYN